MAHHIRLHARLLVAACVCSAAAGMAVPGAALLAQAAQNPGTLSPSPEEPPTRQGTRGANFLQIGIGARENAMAGAVNTLVEGPNSWYWNPAGGASMERFSASASRQALYTDLDIAMNYVGVAVPLGGGVIGAHFTSLNSGDIERTSTNNPYGDNALGLDDRQVQKKSCRRIPRGDARVPPDLHLEARGRLRRHRKDGPRSDRGAALKRWICQ